MNSTHGLTATVANEEASRKVSISLFADDSYGISIETVWAGNPEPVATRIRLQPAGFKLLLDAMCEASINMHLYKIKEQS